METQLAPSVHSVCHVRCLSSRPDRIQSQGARGLELTFLKRKADANFVELVGLEAEIPNPSPTTLSRPALLVASKDTSAKVVLQGPAGTENRFQLFFQRHSKEDNQLSLALEIYSPIGPEGAQSTRIHAANHI